MLCYSAYKMMCKIRFPRMTKIRNWLVDIRIVCCEALWKLTIIKYRNSVCSYSDSIPGEATNKVKISQIVLSAQV